MHFQEYLKNKKIPKAIYNRIKIWGCDNVQNYLKLNFTNEHLFVPYISIDHNITTIYFNKKYMNYFHNIFKNANEFYLKTISYAIKEQHNVFNNFGEISLTDITEISPIKENFL